MVVTNPCSVCKRAVARTHRAVPCQSCHLKCHIKCGKIAPKDYNNVLENQFWRCPSCESMLNLRISDNVYGDLLNTLNGAKTGLTIGHINVNGLRGKIAEIRRLLSEQPRSQGLLPLLINLDGRGKEGPGGGRSVL